jgi:hypothetical protein
VFANSALKYCQECIAIPLGCISVGTQNLPLLTTGHLSAQMSSGQESQVMYSNKRYVRTTLKSLSFYFMAMPRHVRSPAEPALSMSPSRAKRKLLEICRTVPSADSNPSHQITSVVGTHNLTLSTSRQLAQPILGYITSDRLTSHIYSVLLRALLASLNNLLHST